MKSHPTIDELHRWRRGEMEGEEVLEIGHHLASCSACVQRATQKFDLGTKADALYDDIVATPRARTWWPYALAAAIAIAVLTLVLWPRSSRTQRIEPPMARATQPLPPSPAPHSPDTPDEMTALVDAIRAEPRIEMPEVLRAMRRAPDVLRGGESATSSEFTPSGVVVRSTRPQLAWPEDDDAQYVVQLFRGEEEVARSGVLTNARWTPAEELSRNETYTWQVRVTRGEETEIVPTAPDPLARFHVLDADALAELEDAEEKHAENHLLLGILCARAGLDGDAREHLGRVTGERDEAAARTLLEELERW